MLLLLMAVFQTFGERASFPGWDFSVDLPEGYTPADNNGKNRYSFSGPSGARFDIAVYSGEYQTLKNLADDVCRRLKNSGDTAFFDYHGKNAAIIALNFIFNGEKMEGWGLAVDLTPARSGAKTPMLAAFSYAPAAAGNIAGYHLSALDSISPSVDELHYPGPVMEFAFPRGGEKKIALAKEGVEALIREHDAEAAQALVDREFMILRDYLFQDNWPAAWIRFYRAVYRDSWNRIADAAARLEQSWNAGAGQENAGRVFAEKVLAWVQSFKYERDFMGSDFVNLVTAVTEGRGDCDSRAMLWAMILAQADIPAAIMVSRSHSHAMGLAGIPGAGARFEAGGKKWLVAETTATAGIGLIDQNFSNAEAWLGVIFE